MKRRIESRSCIGNWANIYLTTHEERAPEHIAAFVRWADRPHCFETDGGVERMMELADLSSRTLVTFIIDRDKARMAAGKPTYSRAMLRQIEGAVRRAFPMMK